MTDNGNGLHSQTDLAQNGDSPTGSSLVDDIGEILTRLDVDPLEETSEEGTSWRGDESSSENGEVGDGPGMCPTELGAVGGGESSSPNASSSSLTQEESSTASSPNDDIWRENVDKEDGNHSNQRQKQQGGSANGVKSATDTRNPIKKFLNRLSHKKAKPKEATRQLTDEDILSRVKVKSLPQTFLTKHLGHRPCKGIYGIKHTRGPVEELVQTATKMKKGTDLPLMKINVSAKGLEIKAHVQTERKGHETNAGAEATFLPIEFISYGVQDVRYPRIFALVIVRELTSKSKTLECHAYIVDSAITCRRLAMSMAMAFQEYAQTLQGRPHTFQVDLRTPNEIEKDPSKEECEV